MIDDTTAAPVAAEDENAPAPEVEQVDEKAAIWAELRAAEKAEEEGKAPPPPKLEGDTPPEPAPAPADDKTDLHARQLEAEERRKTQLEASAATATGEDQQKIEHSIKSATGRINALQKKIAAAKENNPSRDKKTARDAIAGIRDDYPEIAKPIEDALSHIEGRMDRLSKAEASAREADQAELNSLVEAETNRLLAKHSDYVAVINKNGATFRQWVDDQPRRLRDAAYRNAEHIVDAGEAIEVVERFKRHLGIIKDDPAPTTQQSSLSDRRQRQIEASASPSRTSSRPAVAGAPHDGDRQALWKYWKDHEERA